MWIACIKHVFHVSAHAHVVCLHCRLCKTLSFYVYPLTVPRCLVVCIQVHFYFRTHITPMPRVVDKSFCRFQMRSNQENIRQNAIIAMLKKIEVHGGRHVLFWWMIRYLRLVLRHLVYYSSIELLQNQKCWYWYEQNWTILSINISPHSPPDLQSVMLFTSCTYLGI